MGKSRKNALRRINNETKRFALDLAKYYSKYRFGADLEKQARQAAAFIDGKVDSWPPDPLMLFPYGNPDSNSTRLLEKAATLGAEHSVPPAFHILITGEAGSGEGVVSKLIYESGRKDLADAKGSKTEEAPDKEPSRDGWLMRLNVGTIPAHQLEERLLGGRDFSGRLIPGAFVLAHGGVLVLRGVEKLTEEGQQVLLRIVHRTERGLTPGGIMRLGKNEKEHAQAWAQLLKSQYSGCDKEEAIAPDVITGLSVGELLDLAKRLENAERGFEVRILSVSYEDLAPKVNSGGFDQHLYLHLAQARIDIPPLRERKEDIVPLVGVYLHKMARKPGAVVFFDQKYLDDLTAYHWPGNVSELGNEIARALAYRNREREKKEGGICVEHTPMHDDSMTLKQNQRSRVHSPYECRKVTDLSKDERRQYFAEAMNAMYAKTKDKNRPNYHGAVQWLEEKYRVKCSIQPLRTALAKGEIRFDDERDRYTSG